MPPTFPLACLLCVLIGQLGSESFRTREKAHHALQELLPLSGPHLEAAALSPDAEVRVRVQLIWQDSRGLAWTRLKYRREAQRKAEAARPRNYPLMPWINHLLDVSPLPPGGIAWQEYLRKAQREGYSEVSPDFHASRRATVLWLRDRYEQGDMDEDMIQFTLTRMAEGEITWIVRHGGECVPPVELPRGFPWEGH